MAFYKNNLSQNLPSIQSPHKQRIIQIARLANYQPAPSILPSKEDFNFTVLDNGHIRRKIKQQIVTDISRGQKYHEKPRRMNSPPQCQLPKLISKNNRTEHHPTNTSENAEQLYTMDTQIQAEENITNENSTLPYSRISNKPKAILSNSRSYQNCQSQVRKKKVSKRYNGHFSGDNAYSSSKSRLQEEVEQESSEYEDDATPGPGYYSLNNSTFNTNSSSSGMSINNGTYSFGCKSNRFRNNPEKEKKLMDTRIFNLQNKQKRTKQRLQRQKKAKQHSAKIKIIPFLSGSLKDKNQIFNLNEASKIPGPFDYHPRNGIEEELIKKIQKNFKGNFGVCEERFRVKDSGYDSLGPGQYAPPHDKTDKQLLKDQMNPSHFFLSKKSRF